MTKELSPREERKRNNFRRLAELRVNNAIHALESLGKLGNKNNYSYTKTQKDQILREVQKAHSNMRNAFEDPEKHKPAGFILGD